MENFEFKTSEIAEIAAKFDLVADERLEKFAKLVISLASDFSRSDRTDAYDDGLLKGVAMVADDVTYIGDFLKRELEIYECFIKGNRQVDLNKGRVEAYQHCIRILNNLMCKYGFNN